MRTLVVCLCILFVFTSLVGVTWAKNTRDERFSNYRFVELPQSATTQSGLPNGSMFKSAAAGTTLLGWWVFQKPTGEPDEQGWTKTDATAPVDTNFHVDGTAGAGPNCCPITPVNGLKSMWCGQCPTSDYRYCGYATLPGYGNSWVQSLESQTLACSTLTVSYTAVWDTEPGYDYFYVQYWDGVLQDWVDLPIDGGAGNYDGVGGPLFENFVINPPDYSTRLRFHFISDGAWSDQDGLWPTNEGAGKFDDITVSCSDAGGEFSYFEDWEDEVCGQGGSNDGIWVGGATAPPGFGIYAALHSGTNVVQEDPCRRVISSLWGFFDNPLITNYACGGWPQQGAVPYGPDDNGLYMYNEIWSPVVPYVGTGDEVELSFKVYRDLKLDALVFFVWHVRAWVDDCPVTWQDFSFVHYGDQKDWLNMMVSVGSLVNTDADDVQVALGCIDMCGIWCGVFGTGACHSHGPLFDDVRLVRIDSEGPQWVVRDIDIFHDDFPQTYDDPVLAVTDYGRADMAQDILPNYSPGILPGDSIAFTVTNVVADFVNPPSVYLFACVKDRFGNVLGVPPTDNGLPYPAGQPAQGAMMSPEVDVPTGTVCRFPNVAATVPGGLPAGWYQFQCDYCRTTGPTRPIVPDRYCCDLMDATHVGDPLDPPGGRWWEAESGGPSCAPGPYGAFLPSQTSPVWQNGMVIRYFLGAHDDAGNWTFWHRQNDRPGPAHLYTMEGQTFNNVQATPPWDEACEFSILPDAGNRVGDAGDILFVDDADDRGGDAHAQYYFDTCFSHLGILDRVDRFDVLGPSSCVDNSLASRARSAQNQMIGGLWEIYQKVLWNSSNLSRCLVCDGRESGGSGADKSNDWALLEFFMDFHSWSDPGNFFAGDDMAEDWNTLAGGASYRSKYMTYNLVTGDHKTVGIPISPMVYQNVGMPIGPDSMWAFGGCLGINDFDVMSSGNPGACLVNSSYDTPNSTVQGAKMIQAVPNAAGRTARCVLEGFGFDYIRDDQTSPPQADLDRCVQLYDILVWFQNILDEPVGIDPVAFENRLDNAFPNPFNPTTTIKYGIAERGHVSLKIYNAAGQLVRTLVDDMQTPVQGGFSEIWNGRNNQGQPVSSGVYFYKLMTEGFTQTKKMVLLK